MLDNNGVIYTIKKNGEREPFSEEKVLRSMARVKLPEALRPQVLRHIKQRLHQDIETTEIFAHILEFLNKNHPQSSLRFNLKQAIFDLGPTGFPFERYMQRIFEKMGYTTKVDQILNGECVTHEIDLVLHKNGKKEIIEAKFHNQQGIRTDIHVLMYTYARFLDVKETNDISAVWVVTNTKLSIDATRYARCKGIKVIGWNYPQQYNLQQFVEDPHMYPITILNTLTRDEKQSLMNGNIIFCGDFLQTSDEVLKRNFFLSAESIKLAKAQAHLLYDKDPVEDVKV